MNNKTLWDVFEQEAVLPYAGTSGWSGSDTSRERAEQADSDGTTSKRQMMVVDLLGESGRKGMTWRDLSERTGWHHGTASGALSVLHKSGVIARLTERRGRCAVYALPEFVGERETAAHRPNASRLILTELLDELEWMLSAGRVAEARSLIHATKEAL
jgi:DNA-binding MarR family transcriptional regulator